MQYKILIDKICCMNICFKMGLFVHVTQLEKLFVNVLDSLACTVYRCTQIKISFHVTLRRMSVRFFMYIETIRYVQDMYIQNLCTRCVYTDEYIQTREARIGCLTLTVSPQNNRTAFLNHVVSKYHINVCGIVNNIILKVTYINRTSRKLCERKRISDSTCKEMCMRVYLILAILKLY